jgi:hypothetical protein
MQNVRVRIPLDALGVYMWNNYDFKRPSVRAEYDEKHNWWILLRGPETFYDEERRLMVWDSKKSAFEWVRHYHPEYEIIDESL